MTIYKVSIIIKVTIDRIFSLLLINLLFFSFFDSIYYLSTYLSYMKFQPSPNKKERHQPLRSRAIEKCQTMVSSRRKRPTGHKRGRKRPFDEHGIKKHTRPRRRFEKGGNEKKAKLDMKLD